MDQLARIRGPGGGGQAQQGIELGEIGVAVVFHLDQLVFRLAHIDLGLEHIQARRRPTS